MLSKLETPPRRHADRRNGFTVAFDWPITSDANRPNTNPVLATSLFKLLGDNPGECGEVRLRPNIAFQIHSTPIEQFTAGRHQPGPKPGTADIDRKDDISSRIGRD